MSITINILSILANDCKNLSSAYKCNRDSIKDEYCEGIVLPKKKEINSSRAITKPFRAIYI